MAGEGQITVHCSCGKKLKAPATSAGRKARCPACGAVVRLVASEAGASTAAVTSGIGRSAGSTAVVSDRKSRAVVKPSVAAAQESFDADADGLGALYELSAQADSAAVVPGSSMCPSCQSRMEDGAVLCTGCGYDTRTRKSLGTARESAAVSTTTPWGSGKRSGKRVNASAPAGSFILGIVLSCVAGLFGGIVWLLMIEIAGFLIGIFGAMGLGCAIGWAMRLGQQGQSRRGGLTAAGITLFAMAGPVLLFMFIAMCGAGVDRGAQLGVEFFRPLTIIAILVGGGTAYGIANGTNT